MYTRALGDIYARGARARGIEGGQTGMVTALQRAGGALNTNVHFHTLVLDGGFTEAPWGALAFHPAPGPSDAEVAAALATIRHRVQRLLVRHGLEPGDDATGPADRLAEESPVLAGIVGASVQGRVALGQRAGARVRRLGDARDAEAVTSRGPRQAHLEGFDLHANVWVSGNDRAGLERLCRYVLRPPFAEERPAAAERRARRARAEDGLARRDAGAGVRAAGVVGAPGGDDATAGNEHADFPWLLAPRARWRERVVAYGRGAEPRPPVPPLAEGPRAQREARSVRLDLGGPDAPGVRG